MIERASLVAHLRQTLVATASRNGGWAYYAGKSSRIEPTCWALLALADTWNENPDAWQRLAAPHVQWLTATQRASDGLLIDNPGAPPNLTANGLGACVVAHLASVAPDSLLQRLLDGIVGIKGVSVKIPDPRQDSSLQGWPWMPDTFSWVEPTCWCMLALKKTRARPPAAAEARIQEAEKLVLNRSCSVGGWNAGNASAFGQDLRPYVPTTALGLIAMQDRRTDPVVARSLAYLDGVQLGEPSGLALSLTAICLRIYGHPADDVEARLAGDAARAERLGNLQTLAMMLYALSADQHQVKAFRLSPKDQASS